MQKPDRKKEPRPDQRATVFFHSSIPKRAADANKDCFVITPHWYFRGFMQHANETQLKIVGAIINQTFGWHKKYDVSTLGVLAKNIGMSRDAVSRNIQPLIDAGVLVLVNDKHGSLDTPQKRKRSGVEGNQTAFAVPDKLVLTEDKITILKQPVTRQAKQSTSSKTTHTLRVSNNKIKISKEKKEIETMYKFSKNFNTHRCQKCGQPVEAMERMRTSWKLGAVLCRLCTQGGGGLM